jgi:hypothetical protein
MAPDVTVVRRVAGAGRRVERGRWLGRSSSRGRSPPHTGPSRGAGVLPSHARRQLRAVLASHDGAIARAVEREPGARP